MKRKQISNFIRFFFGGLVLLLIVWKADLNQIYKSLTQFNFWFLIPIVILNFLSFFLGSLNFKILFSPLEKIKLSNLIKYYMLSWSFGLVVPGKIGEFSLVFFLRKKEGINMGKSLALSIIDKIITFGSYYFFAIIGLFLFMDVTIAIRISIILFLAVILFVTLLFYERPKELIKKYILKKQAKKFTGFQKTINDYLKNKKEILLLNILITIIKIGLLALVLKLILNGFSFDASFLNILIIHSSAMLVSLIPVSISGLGVKEATIVYFLQIIGIPLEVAIGLSLINLVIRYTTAFLIFLSSKLD